MLKFLKRFFSEEKKYKIDDLKETEFYQKFNQGELRNKIKVLFIDDESVPVIEILKDEKFNVSYKNDIQEINDVSAYNIICCDIRGICTKKYPKFEGAFLIKEIKEIYPEKYVIAYTGSSYDPTYNKYLNLADDVIKKGMESETWIDKLDSSIKIYFDPIERWKKIRTEMFNKNISTQFVADLEHEYVKAIKNRSSESVENLISNIKTENRNQDVRALKTILGIIKELLLLCE